HLVQAESTAPEDVVVTTQQQQLSADRPAHVAPLLRGQQGAVPPEFLYEEQAVDPEGTNGRTGSIRADRGRPASRRTGGSAARAAEAGRRDFPCLVSV